MPSVVPRAKVARSAATRSGTAPGGVGTVGGSARGHAGTLRAPTGRPLTLTILVRMPQHRDDPASWPTAPRFGTGPGSAPASTSRRGHRAAPAVAAEDPRPVRSVLFVCTGNVCRSPFAERLLRARVPGPAVASRGTFSLIGHAMDADMAAELAARGGDGASFRSRQLAIPDLGADLILAMGPEHLAHIRDEMPSALRRSGLLGSIGDLAASPGEPLTTQDVAAWTRRRHDGGAIEDPFRRGRAAAARTADRIDALIAHLAPLLSPSGYRR